MQQRWITPLAVAAALVAPAVAQAQDLRVSVSAARPSVAASQDVEVTLRYTNAGKETLYLLKWFVPGADLKEPLFQISRDGKSVDYIGPHYKRRAPTIDDMVALLPGKTLTTTVKLGKVYDLSQSGNYSVRFNADLDHMLGKPAAGTGSRLQAEAVGAVEVESQALVSGAVSMWVEGRVSPLLQQAQEARQMSALLDRALASSITYAANCSTSRRTQIASGVSAASTMANGANTYLAGTPSGTTRYVTWFGKYSSTNWNTAKTHYTKIKGALDSKPLSFDCGCTESGTYAYVYPDQPYKIYLCGAFWSAPTTGTDSKGGTIVHELSHFTAVAGTDDHAYGQSAAKSLAKSNPTKALDNADNHEYFAENTPSLP